MPSACAEAGYKPHPSQVIQQRPGLNYRIIAFFLPSSFQLNFDYPIANTPESTLSPEQASSRQNSALWVASHSHTRQVRSSALHPACAAPANHPISRIRLITPQDTTNQTPRLRPHALKLPKAHRRVSAEIARILFPGFLIYQAEDSSPSQSIYPRFSVRARLLYKPGHSRCISVFTQTNTSTFLGLVFSCLGFLDPDVLH